MTSAMEGKIVIELDLAQEQVEAVRITSQRPLHASQVLHSQPVRAAAQTIPLLFSLCGTAQASAAAQACEQASGITVSPLTAERREALVDMETLREHLWRILLDWPKLCGTPPFHSVMAEVLKIVENYRQALNPQHDLFLPGAQAAAVEERQVNELLQQLSALLQQHLFALTVEAWLALEEPEALVQWAHQHSGNAAAQVVQMILEADWGSAGACTIRDLPALNSEQLAQAMRHKAFIEQPMWQGECCETTSLSRTTSPLLAKLRHDHGNGLLSRVVARLSEVASLLLGLAGKGLCESDDIPRDAATSNPGIGQVAAARGQLVHRVEVENGLVRSYRILAPTEWNFHPQGVLARALAALRGDSQQIAQQTRLLVNSIDPCVGYELRMNGAMANHA